MFGNAHWDDSLPAPSVHPTTSYAPTIPSTSNDPLPLPADPNYFKMMNPWADMENIDVDVMYNQPSAETMSAPEVPQIDDPFANVDMHNLPYTRILSNGRIIYRHPTAGQIFGRAETPWEAQRRRNMEEYGGNRWGIWRTQDEWESAKWMATTRVSQSSLDKLLKTVRYKQAGYSFETSKQLFKIIEDDMEEFGGPEWHAVDVALAGAEKDKATLFYRDIEACADYLFGRPLFTGKMAFAPEQLFDSDNETRLYENPWTADYWNQRQASLPIRTTLGGLIIVSDATQLSTHSGDVAAHAVYMTLANLDKSTRAQTSENGWILVAYIPKDSFHHTIAKMETRPEAVRQKVMNMLNRRLFHWCMEVVTRPLVRNIPHLTVDPEGNVRSVLYKLLGYVADLEEQHLVSCTGSKSCPHCECDGTNIGHAECSPPRTPAEVLKRIKDIKEHYQQAYNRPINLEEFLALATKERLNGVDEPFWEHIPNLNIFNALSPDLLHGYHKFFFDHIHKWDVAGVGKDEYNARIKAQIHLASDRAFPKGISHISQMTGMEHRALARSHLSIIADAPDKISQTSIAATRAALDLVYLSQLPIHTERSLAAYRQAYTDLMEHRWGWWKRQTVRWLTRRERMRDFEQWMRWCSAERAKNGEIDETELKDVFEDVGAESESEFGSEFGPESELGVKAESETEPGDLGEIDEEFEYDLQSGEWASGELADDNWDEVDDESDQAQEEYEERIWGYTHDDREGGPTDTHDYIARYLQGLQVEGQDSVEGQGLVEGQGRGQKRKHSTVGGEGLPGIDPRSQPRPRLQDSHSLSQLQKINQLPSLRRQTLEDIGKTFAIDLRQILRAVNRNSYLSSLPITVDEYALVDTWDALRTHLYSHTINLKAQMQRIRAKPARGRLSAQCDPVYYITDSTDPSIVQLQ
ncbi:hypothetical protein FRC10_001395, partial [Ceratobasidium sp. 414]